MPPRRREPHRKIVEDLRDMYDRLSEAGGVINFIFINPANKDVMLDALQAAFPSGELDDVCIRLSLLVPLRVCLFTSGDIENDLLD